MAQKQTDILAIGQQALDSGLVSPEEVEAAQTALSTPGGQDWLSSFLKGPDPLGLNSAKSPMRLPEPEEKKATGIGKQLKQDTKSNTDARKSRTETLYASGDEFLDLTNRLRDLPEYREQAEGIKKMEDVFNMMSGMKGGQDWIVQPLLALADAQTGSRLSASYTPQATRSEKLLKYADDIQRRKGDLSKSIMEGVSKLKTGSETNALTQQLMQQLGYTQGMLANSGANQQGLTVGETAVDKAYAKDYTDFILGGGYSSAVGNLEKMGTIVDRLRSEKDLTGNKVGIIPKAVRDLIYPKSADLQDQYEQIVQQNLKAVLGAQFTEHEAKRLIERSFNPRLEQEFNAKRILEVQKQMAEALEAKRAAANYFEQNNYSMRGYKGARRVVIGGKTYDITQGLDKSDSDAALKKITGGGKTEGTGTVRVKNPSGQVGTIPASQLQDALSQGYEEVK